MGDEEPKKPEFCNCCDRGDVELIFIPSPVGIENREGWFCYFCRKTYAIRSYQYPDRYDNPLYVTLVRLAWEIVDVIRDDLNDLRDDLTR
jgi:hypothetical protein